MTTTSPATHATIYHNTRCSTSRRVLAMIEAAGITPTVVAYLDTPPSRDGLRKLLDDAGLAPSQAIRRKEPLYSELGLADADEDALLDAMAENPILIERPIVVTDRGTVLARPVENLERIL